MSRFGIAGLCTVAVALVFAACGRSDGGAQGAAKGATYDGGVIKITATTGMVGDLLGNVGGKHVKVTTLMGPGVDPHLYQATAGDIASLQGADMIFYSGLLLEGKMAELFVQMARRNPFVVAVTEEVDRERLLEPPALLGHWDPHVWFDVDLWSEGIEVARASLAEYAPVHAAEFQANADAYRAQLAELHAWCIEEAATVPEARRIVITSHDAFSYFGRAYGFEVVGLQGISTVTEAGLADIARMTDFIKQRQVPAIFVESSVPKAAIERVAEDSGVKIGGELFSDAMGAAGSPEGTYIGMVRHNMELVVNALSDPS
jgi:manganese/zinc/iron transport system substrate-binding protein